MSGYICTIESRELRIISLEELWRCLDDVGPVFSKEEQEGVAAVGYPNNRKAKANKGIDIVKTKKDMNVKHFNSKCYR